jgi:UDP-N-acetylmuramoyl-L-alanyl-D-glutamate--2,6-diaminopimelate ligase
MGVKSILKKIIPTGLFRHIEPTGHLFEAFLLHALAGFPFRGVKVIGVTGTNGKTSTASLIHRMMVESGYKVGLMTTVSFGVGNDIQQQKAHMTSVGVKELLERIKSMKAQGMEWLVLETTSHALAQHRVWGVPFSIVVMTNVTHEHLDYHGTFENYRDAKRRLFKLCRANKAGFGVGIINAEDPSADLFAGDIENPLTYGVAAGQLRATHIKLTPSGSRYRATIDGEEYSIECHLPGTFNVYNSLAAVAVGRTLGLSKKQVKAGLSALKGVEGRMNRIDEGQNFGVIVDYAHTPDSFGLLFKDLKPVIKGKLIVLFGSAGRRDEAKRQTQGQLAGQFADEVILTEEDDRDIDGQEILDQIAEGAEAYGKKRGQDLFLIHDRREAIKFALGRAKPGDSVLLLGKGHEKDILRPGPKAATMRHLPQDDHNPDRVISIPWDESEVARELLRAMN